LVRLPKDAPSLSDSFWKELSNWPIPVSEKNSYFELKKLLDTLHPTPAVCGLPKESSKSFILANENYDRTYYTGFLGEINVDLETALYVNLRCVEIVGTTAIIYVGGGITLESIPENEWSETSNKTFTIKSIL
jgi:isochorismate synthase